MPDGWEQSLLDVVVPNRAIGVDEQNVTSVKAPKCPDKDVQTNAGQHEYGQNAHNKQEYGG